MALDVSSSSLGQLPKVVGKRSSLTSIRFLLMALYHLLATWGEQSGTLLTIIVLLVAN